MIGSYSEDELVQQTMADYFEQELGWRSVYAYNQEHDHVDQSRKIRLASKWHSRVQRLLQSDEMVTLFLVKHPHPHCRNRSD